MYRWFNNYPAVKKFFEYIAVISFSLIGLVTMLVISWVKRGFVEPAGENWWTPVFTAPTGYLLSVPLAFAVWLLAAESERPFKWRFSWPACLLSLYGFTGGIWFMMANATLLHKDYYANTCAVYGVMGGLFVFVSVKDCWDYAARDLKKTSIAFFAAGTSAGYQFFIDNLWTHLCYSTAVAVHWLLSALGLSVRVTATRYDNVILSSPHFGLKIYRPCSGLEGIFVFLFLLSALFIIDWRLFRKMPLLLIYPIGFIYMFLINALRIATLFTVGYFAWQPDASPFMHSLRKTPLEMFHSMIGMIYYLIAFMLFAVELYIITVSLYKSRKADPPSA